MRPATGKINGHDNAHAVKASTVARKLFGNAFASTMPRPANGKSASSADMLRIGSWRAILRLFKAIPKQEQNNSNDRFHKDDSGIEHNLFCEKIGSVPMQSLQIE